MHRIVLFFTLLPHIVQAQDGAYYLGGRNTALSGASVTLADHWAIFNNPGALGSLQTSSAMVSYQNRYNLAGFHVVGGGFVYHHELANAGVKYFKFGDQLFNQQIAGLVLANRFQMVSLGLGVNVIQTHIEGQQTNRIIALEMGGTAEITNQILLGAHIFNFKHGQNYPTTMKAGLSFRPTSSLKINAEVEKQLEAREKVKSGLEYEIIENVFVRTGVNIQSNDLSKSLVYGTFGLGLGLKGLLFDYAFTNEDLGAIHEISLAYQLKTKP